MIQNEKKERVVITGMGIVCPLGHDIETMWQAVLAGKSGVAKTTIFDASTFPTTFSAEVKNYDVASFVKNPDLHKNGNRGSKFVVGAAVQACTQAGINIETDNPTDGIDRKRIGIYLVRAKEQRITRRSLAQSPPAGITKQMLWTGQNGPTSRRYK